MTSQDLGVYLTKDGSLVRGERSCLFLDSVGQLCAQVSKFELVRQCGQLVEFCRRDEVLNGLRNIIELAGLAFSGRDFAGDVP